MPRSKKPTASPSPTDDVETEEPDDSVDDAEPELEPDVEPEVEPDPEEVAAVADEDEDDDEDEGDDVVAVDDAVVDEELVHEVEVDEKPLAAVRPAGRPSPGRPPGAKEEPDPPFFVGERIRLIQNTRPRTGVPIGDYPVGTLGRVETVLSLTCIVRFDLAPEIKEVVAFTCLESIDEEAQARRRERDALKAAEGL